MNQGFKLRYDELRENDPTGAADKQAPAGHDNLYTGQSYARSLCFVWPDGKRVLMNYAYFVSAEFDIVQDKNWIRLNFSTAAVLLSGYRLEELFLQLLEHVPRIIEVNDERYANIENSIAGVVTDIVIERKDS
jgi:hypothetical protein